MTLAQSQYTTTNYMVPSNGQTHALKFKGTASDTPFLIDWRQFTIDAQLFQPQGAFIDNSAGTVPLVINVQPIDYNIIVAAGTTAQVQFPAPNGQWMYVTGDPANEVSIVFVDFPVLPSGLQAQIVNVPTVQVQGTVEVDALPLAAGNTLPYRDQEYIPAVEFKGGSITGAATSVVLTPATAQQNLRKLILSVTGNASLAAAGPLTLTVTANAVTIFQAAIYLPNAAPATPSPLAYSQELNFDMLGIPVAASNVTVTLSSALASGSLNANAYFTPQ